MGKSNELNFGGKKNYFKPRIIERIQEVFEDDSLNLLKSAKNKEEKEIYHALNKENILGSKFYILVVANS